MGDYRRRRGERVVVLDPFGPPGGDTLNPLDAIPRGDGLVDAARALAASLVVPEAGSRDPHWDAKAQQVAAGVLVGVLLLMRPEDQTLNAVQDIASDAELLWGLADKPPAARRGARPDGQPAQGAVREARFVHPRGGERPEHSGPPPGLARQ